MSGKFRKTNVGFKYSEVSRFTKESLDQQENIEILIKC